MERFFYRGFDRNGIEETGSLDAHDERSALEMLASRGTTVVALTDSLAKAENVPWYKRDIQFRRNRFSVEDEAEVASLLGALFSVGLPAAEAINVAAQSTNRPTLQRQFDRIANRVQDGSSLGDAFSSENELFSDLFVSFVRIGDSTNRMSELMAILAGYLTRQASTRQTVVSSLIYPAILIVAGILLVLVIAFFLAPNLTPLFLALDRPPPTVLRVLEGFGVFLDRWWPAIGITAIGSGAIAFVLGRTDSGGRFGAALIRSIPLAGHLLRSAQVVRITEALALFLKAGEPLPSALRSAANSAGADAIYLQAFREAAEAVETGKNAASVFDHHVALPAGFRTLFRVGETANRLPEAMDAAAHALGEQVERRRKRALLMITPAITLVIGSAIGTLVYTLMSAMLQVNELAF